MSTSLYNDPLYACYERVDILHGAVNIQFLRDTMPYTFRQGDLPKLDHAEGPTLKRGSEGSINGRPTTAYPASREKPTLHKSKH